MNLAPNPDSPRPPPGGKWRYCEDAVNFAADSFSELAIMVKAHFVHKLLTIGEVEQRILTQTKLTAPWLVVTSNSPLPNTSDQIIFRTYIRRLGSREYVDADIAEARFAACLACPFNHPCEIDDEAQRTLFIITRGKALPGLGLCSFFHHHNAIACIVEDKPEQSDIPALCWRK